MKKNIRLFLLLIFACALTACGWQLRGAPKNFPPGSTLYITAEDPRSDIAEQLTRLLRNGGIPMAESPQLADYVLTIHQETEQRRTVAVNAKGRVAEYELITSALYSVADRDGRILLNNAEADVYRALEWDDSETVSKGEEELLLRAEMRRELISRMIDRLRRIDIGATLEERSY
ncbi:LPS-assembly lipoprotein LptE [Microbulbifer aestuariivivens]|uniref:LPS-assembly lipoprotein LptE n=1 Tax=Microbulbifer aestuariivivens TaxID=1908308 RepID=A0ABP9WLQ6_9GAMM